jgi:hypothetical protein
MSKAPKKTTDIDPAKEYRVRFKKFHQVKRQEFRPLHVYYMSGALLAELPAEKIATFEVAEPLRYDR